MSLGQRVGFIAGNIAALFPIFMLLLVAVIFVTDARKKVDKLGLPTKTTKMLHAIEITLWVLLVGGVAFVFTIGMFILPWLVSLPYLFGFMMLIVAAINAAVAAVCFIVCEKIKKSPSYTSKTPDAIQGYKRLLACGIMMTVSAVGVMAYTVFEIYHYHKQGGMRGDVALMGRYGGEIANYSGMPEFGIPLQMMGKRAEAGLNPQQRYVLNQRHAQIRQMQQTSQAGGGIRGSIKTFLNKPGMAQKAESLAEEGAEMAA